MCHALLLRALQASQCTHRWLAHLWAGDIDPDAAIVAADALCAQALEAQAEDMAVEDTLYALERSFQSGGLAADVYLKQVQQKFYVLTCDSTWQQQLDTLAHTAFAAHMYSRGIHCPH